MLLLAACGGGGSPGDIHPGTTPAPVAGEPNAFLLFPNPQVQPDGSLQTNTPAYAQAYYAAIDPNNAKDTLAKWKAANGFDTSTGTQVTAVFGDSRDLGFGRRMTARQNPDGTLAFCRRELPGKDGREPTTFLRSTSKLRSCATRSRWCTSLVSSSAPVPRAERSFAKFFNFNVVTGVRENLVDIDGRGDKAMPGPCITCHGGRADALTPPDAVGQAALQPAAERGIADPRRHAGAAAAVRGRQLPVLHDAWLHASGAGGRPQDDEQDDPVLVSACPRRRRFRKTPADAGERRRVAGYGRRAGQVVLWRRWPAQSDLRGRQRAGVMDGGGTDVAVHDGDRARVPPVSHHARNGHAVGHRFHDVREIPAVCGADFCDRRQPRQHAAGEARVRRVPRLARRSRRWRISSAAKASPRATRAGMRCGPAVRSQIPDRIACSGRAPRGCPAPTACSRTPMPGRSCRFRTGRSPAGATLTDANTAQPTFNAASDGTYVLSLVVGNDSAPKRAEIADAGGEQCVDPGARAPSASPTSRRSCRTGPDVHGLPQSRQPAARADLFHQ